MGCQSHTKSFWANSPALTGISVNFRLVEKACNVLAAT